MNQQEKEEKIAENKRMIAALQEEIKQLRSPSSLGELITEPLYGWEYNRETKRHEPGKYRVLSYSDEWAAIRRLCVTLFTRQGKVSQLSEEEKVFAAKMANEIIKVRNEYFLMFHDIDEEQTKGE